MLRFKGSSRSQVIRTLPEEYNFQSVYQKITEILIDKPILLSFFSKPLPAYNQTFVWEMDIDMLSSNDVKSITELNEIDKRNVLDSIDRIKTELSELLIEEVYFKEILDRLFYVPKKEDIKIFNSKSGANIFLTQWGHRLLEDEAKISPLTRILNVPRLDRAKVLITLSYSNNSIAKEKDFYVDYLGNTRTFTTGEDGIKNLGFYKLGAKLVIHDLIDGKSKYHQSFTVSEAENYEIVFPLWVDAKLQVVNQFQEPIPDIEVLIEYNDRERTELIDKEGILELLDLEVSKEIKFSLVKNEQTQGVFKIKEEGNHFILEMIELIYSSSTLKVINQRGEVLPNQIVWADYQGVSKKIITNNEGLISLGKFELGSTVVFREIDKEENNQSYTLEDYTESFVFTIDVPEPKLVKVRLIDKENKIVPNTKIDFIVKGQLETKITDKDGCCVFPVEYFENNKKVKTIINLTRKDKKVKQFKKQFKFNSEVLDYTLKLKKRNKWWLLLFGLLLLLFIPYKKNVAIKLLGNQSSVQLANVMVSYQYQKQFFYDTNSLNRETDSTGVVVFKDLKTSVFSAIYSLVTNSRSITNVSNSICFESDTVQYLFHNVFWLSDTVKLHLTPSKTKLNFKIVDKVDLEPLPGVTVFVKSEYLGKTYLDSAISDASGYVLFHEICNCGKIKKVLGGLEGYLPDSIINQTLQDVKGNIDDKRLLKLVPETNQIVFFVTDCLTKQRIPGALVTIDILGRNNKTTQKIHTNVNGVGKGGYDDVHVISEMTLVGEYHPFYDKNELPQYLVKDFVNLPDSLRTICLPPKPNQVTFQNVDDYSKTPLAGVTNEVVIKKGGDQDNYTIMSNKDGYFTFNIGINDTISIVALYPPDYESDSARIKNVIGLNLIKGNPESRTIFLKPKMVNLLFRTVNRDNLEQVVPSANLNTMLLINGKSIPLQTSVSNTNGELIIELPVTALVSIGASKPGFGSNNTKIDKISVRKLIASDQIERDIPLNELPPACNSYIQSGKEGVTIDSYNMENENLSFYIDYDMFSKPDQLTVYCGKRAKLGQILYQTAGQVSGKERAIINLSSCGGNEWITVRIDGSSGTDWTYSIVCP